MEMGRKRNEKNTQFPLCEKRGKVIEKKLEKNPQKTKEGFSKRMKEGITT